MPGPGYGPPDYHYQGSEVSNGHYTNSGQPGGNVFSFKKRFERIDWRKLAAVDVDRISRELDFNTLQENVMNITFCSIESEVDTRNVDGNFIKLFKLAQLTIEYLLHSQDYLASSIQGLEEKLEKAQQEHEETKKALDKKTQELAEAKKESHKRKKLLASQQQLISVGANNYNQCAYCPKSFINLSFLQSHLVRRHGEMSAGVISQPAPSQPPVSQHANLQPYSPHAASEPQLSTMMEKELKEIKERLRFTESQLETERSVWQSRNLKDQDEFLQRQEEQRRELEQWKQEQHDEHRQERDARENMLMKEIRELNQKMALSDKTIHDLQKRVGKKSNLGNLQDDVEYDREELDKQRAEMAVINEQLSTKLKDVESKFVEETKKLKHKMKSRDDQHQDEIKKLTEALESSIVHQREDTLNAGKAAADVYKKQLDNMQKQAKREKLEKEKLEKDLFQREKELHDMASRPPAVAPRKSSASPTPDKRMRSPSPAKKEKPERPPAVVPREESPLKQSVRIDVPKIVEVPPSAEEEDEDEEENEDEEEDVSSDVSVSSLGTTGKEAKDSVDYMTGTTTSFGSGTMEMSLTSKNERVLQVLKKDPKFLEAMKDELSNVLDDALEKRGISSTAKGVSVPVYQNKMVLLKTERQQKAKKHPNFYDIRQQYINQVDELAKEKLRNSKKSPKPGGDSKRTPTARNEQPTPKATPSKSTPKTPSQATPPSYSTPKASSTPKMTPQAAAKPEPRSQSPVKNAGLSQTFSSTASSSQWESEDLSFAESESQVSEEEKTDLPKPHPASPKTQIQNQEDNEEDDWDSDELRSYGQQLPTPPEHVKVIANTHTIPEPDVGDATRRAGPGGSRTSSRLIMDTLITPVVQRASGQVNSTSCNGRQLPTPNKRVTDDAPTETVPEPDVGDVPHRAGGGGSRASSRLIMDTFITPVIESASSQVKQASAIKRHDNSGCLSNEEESSDFWDSLLTSELDEISPSKTAAGSKPYSAPKPKGAMVSQLSKSIEMQLSGRKLQNKPAGSVDLAPPERDMRSASPATPEIKMLGDEDEGSDFSLTSDDGSRDDKAPVGNKLNTIDSSNTYGTSQWGGSSKAPSTLPVNRKESLSQQSDLSMNSVTAASSLNPINTQGTGKSSLVSVTDWDSDDSDLNLDDL